MRVKWMSNLRNISCFSHLWCLGYFCRFFSPWQWNSAVPTTLAQCILWAQNMMRVRCPNRVQITEKVHFSNRTLPTKGALPTKEALPTKGALPTKEALLTKEALPTRGAQGACRVQITKQVQKQRLTFWMLLVTAQVPNCLVACPTKDQTAPLQ